MNNAGYEGSHQKITKKNNPLLKVRFKVRFKFLTFNDLKLYSTKYYLFDLILSLKIMIKILIILASNG